MAVCVYMLTPVIKGQPQGVALFMPEVNRDRLHAPGTRCKGQAGTDNGWMHWMMFGSVQKTIRTICEKMYGLGPHVKKIILDSLLILSQDTEDQIPRIPRKLFKTRNASFF